MQQHCCIEQCKKFSFKYSSHFPHSSMVLSLKVYKNSKQIYYSHSNNSCCLIPIHTFMMIQFSDRKNSIGFYQLHVIRELSVKSQWLSHRTINFSRSIWRTWMRSIDNQWINSNSTNRLYHLSQVQAPDQVIQLSQMIWGDNSLREWWGEQWLSRVVMETTTTSPTSQPRLIRLFMKKLRQLQSQRRCPTRTSQSWGCSAAACREPGTGSRPCPPADQCCWECTAECPVLIISQGTRNSPGGRLWCWRIWEMRARVLDVTSKRSTGSWWQSRRETVLWSQDVLTPILQFIFRSSLQSRLSLSRWSHSWADWRTLLSGHSEQTRREDSVNKMS